MSRLVKARCSPSLLPYTTTISQNTNASITPNITEPDTMTYHNRQYWQRAVDKDVTSSVVCLKMLSICSTWTRLLLLQQRRLMSLTSVTCKMPPPTSTHHHCWSLQVISQLSNSNQQAQDFIAEQTIQQNTATGTQKMYKKWIYWRWNHVQSRTVKKF